MESMPIMKILVPSWAEWPVGNAAGCMHSLARGRFIVVVVSIKVDGFVSLLLLITPSTHQVYRSSKKNILANSLLIQPTYLTTAATNNLVHLLQTEHKNKMSTTKRNYDELKIDGPPLYCNNSAASSPLQKSPTKIDGHLHSSGQHCHCPPLDASKTALLIVDVQPEYW